MSERPVVRWIRVVVVLAIGLVGLFPALFVVGWFTFSGGRFGWIPSLLAFSALGLVIGWAAVSTHWATARKLTSITLAAVGGIVGIAAAHLAPATPGRLRHEVEAFAQRSWQLTNDRVDGNTSCFDSCTSVTREYHVNADVRDVLATLRPVLTRHHCFQPTAGIDPNHWACNGGGDIRVSVDVERELNRVTVVSIAAVAS
jgi:hypothetical protein